MAAAGLLTLLLQRFLVNVLAGMQAFAAALNTAAEALQQFMAEFAFLLGQILLTLSRVGLVLLPGAASLAYGVYKQLWWAWGPGAAYLFLCLIVGVAYRGMAPQSALDGKVPPNWLAFFPYSWTQKEHVASALVRLLESHAELRQVIRQCDRRSPILPQLRQLDFKMRGYLGRARRKIAKRLRDMRKLSAERKEQSLQGLAQQIVASAGKFSELSQWAASVAKHPALLPGGSDDAIVPPEEIASHIERLKAFATALDSLASQDGLTPPVNQPVQRAAEPPPETVANP